MFIVLAGHQNQFTNLTIYTPMHDALPSYRHGVAQHNRYIFPRCRVHEITNYGVSYAKRVQFSKA